MLLQSQPPILPVITGPASDPHQSAQIDDWRILDWNLAIKVSDKEDSLGPELPMGILQARPSVLSSVLSGRGDRKRGGGVGTVAPQGLLFPFSVGTLVFARRHLLLRRGENLTIWGKLRKLRGIGAGARDESGVGEKMVLV